MKVALVYDRVNKWGGAERLLLALHEIWPEAPLYCGVYNPATARWAQVFQVRPSWVQVFPWARTKHEHYPWLMPLGFEAFSFVDFDVVITVTSAEAKGIITKPSTLHICYCLTPTRYLWSHKELYLKSKQKLFRLIAAPLLAYLRQWDQIAAARPDYYLSISRTVQKRIKKYYRRASEVIYPPITLMDGRRRLPTVHNNHYYLVVSRLVAYKRVDLAIKACNREKLPLIVVGEGSEKQRLQRLAGPTVQFVSGLTEEELVRYYQGCRALIMPQEEDFGLVALEAQSCGRPVIAFGKGGALETVVAGQTGEFFREQTVASLRTAIKKVAGNRYNRSLISKQAEKFSKARFKRLIRQYVEAKFDEHQQEKLRQI